MVFGPLFTLGRLDSTLVPFMIRPMPWNPDSDEPMASVSTAFGSTSRNCSFTDGENSAAWLDSATIDEMS